MANKFTKSVLERQEKERRVAAKTQKAVIPPIDTESEKDQNITTIPAEPLNQSTSENPFVQLTEIIPETENIGNDTTDTDLYTAALEQEQKESAAKAVEQDIKELPPPVIKRTTSLPGSKQSTRNSRVSAVPKEPALNLDAFIIQDEGRHAKNKTFYLDTAVIDGIKRAATARKITESKLVNDILKKILGV